MKRKITNSLFLLAVAGLLLAGSAFAQTSPPPATPATAGAGPGVDDAGHPRVNQVNSREERQQQRIGNGIKDGQMKPAQVATVEKHDAKIENQEKRDMAKHNGHLTKAEQRKLNGELNKNSKEIRKDRTQK
jgi:hypothetical protein